MSRIDDLIAKFCPDGVAHKTLNELGSFVRGSTIVKSELSDEGFPAIHYGEIHTKFKLSATNVYSFIKHPKSSFKQAKFNDLIIVTTSEDISGVGKPLAWLGDASPFVSGETYIFKSHENAKYLAYLLASEYFQTAKRPLITGTKVKRIHEDSFRKIKFPIPPLVIQNEIVNVLDKFTELEAELEARKKQYEYYRNELLSFKHLEEGGVRWIPMADVCSRIFSGGTPDRSRTEFFEGSIPWIRTQEVDFNEITFTEISINDAALKSSSAQWVKPNTVILAMYGATAGKSAILRIPATTNQACCNLEVNPEIARPEYVFHWLMNNYEEIRALGQGTQGNLNARMIKELKIPVPALEKQNSIVEILEAFRALTLKVNEGIPAEIAARRKQYEYYRNKLLTFKELDVA